MSKKSLLECFFNMSLKEMYLLLCTILKEFVLFQDLKPSNLGVSENYEVKVNKFHKLFWSVVDFGADNIAEQGTCPLP